MEREGDEDRGKGTVKEKVDTAYSCADVEVRGWAIAGTWLMGVCKL